MPCLRRGAFPKLLSLFLLDPNAHRSTRRGERSAFAPGGARGHSSRNDQRKFFGQYGSRRHSELGSAATERENRGVSKRELSPLFGEAWRQQQYDLHAKGIDLYLYQQSLDTSSPSGRAMCQMMGVRGIRARHHRRTGGACQGEGHRTWSPGA